MIAERRFRDIGVRIRPDVVITTTRSRPLARGKMVAPLRGVIRWSVPSIAAALLAAPLGACFYVDPINERPSADINQVHPDLPFRGEPITVVPNIYDPDNDDPTIAWHAFACGDVRCDDVAYITGSSDIFEFPAPEELDSGVPATRVHIELDVTDHWGAQALPRQTLDLPLADHNPTLAPGQNVGLQFEGTYTVGTPVMVTIRASDVDDVGALTFIEPAPVYPPPGVPVTAATLLRADGEDTDDTASWQLLATQPGEWKVHVEVVDPLDDPDAAEEDRHHAVQDVSVSFDADREPCIGVSDPSFPPDGAFVVVDELRRFSIEHVRDDLDIYPPPPVDDAFHETTRFRWYLDGVRLDVDGNAVELDPERYLPGTQLDLRVEAVDRADQPLCDSSLRTCEDRPGCFQRRSWAVEIR
jgi:hypothetical protein